MKKLLLVSTLAISMGIPAFAGDHRIRMTSPDYSAINDFLEAQAQAQYEAEVQQQLDEITGQITQMTQAVEAAQAQTERAAQQQRETDLYAALRLQQLKDQELAKQAKSEVRTPQEQTRWIEQQKANLRSRNPMVRKQAKANLGMIESKAVKAKLVKNPWPQSENLLHEND